MSSKLTFFTDKLSQNLEKAINDTVSALAKQGELLVKQQFTQFPKPPILTGNLRRNITSSSVGNKAEVRASTPLVVNSVGKKKGGKQVEYAQFVEFGTIKMAPRPFMRLGMDKLKAQAEKIIARYFK